MTILLVGNLIPTRRAERFRVSDVLWLGFASSEVYAALDLHEREAKTGSGGGGGGGQE